MDDCSIHICQGERVSNHVFIVCTPLQLRISLRIKELYKDDSFHVLYLKTKSGVKAHTESILHSQFDTYCIAQMNNNIFNFMKIFKYLTKVVAENSFMYLANADDITVQYILTQFQSKITIRTFDDGILNINSIVDVDRKSKDKTKIKNCLTKFFFKNEFGIKRIADDSNIHFTILKNNRNLNVNSDIVFLNIFDIDSCVDHRSNDEGAEYINIFIGSKFKDILAQKNEENLILLNNKIYDLSKKFSNIIYLRHPRETSDESFGMSEMNVDSISEDIIYDFYSQGKYVNVIGFASTCQINVMSLSGVNIILLKTTLIRQDILDSFSLFDNESKVSIHSLD